MKYVKIPFVVIGFVFIGFIVLALISPKQIAVKETIEIDANTERVYSFVKSLKNTSDHSVWQKKDPNVVKKYTGTDGEIGSIYRWESNVKEVGVGEQEILELIPNKHVKTALRFEKPFAMNDVADFYLEDLGGKTKLVWDYKSETIPIPFNAFVALQGVQGQLEKDFKSSLENFKNVIEQ